MTDAGFAGDPSFDVEAFRASRTRMAVVRRPLVPSVVLGSAQPITVIDRSRADRAGTAVVRRRGGGGVVLVAPDDPLWIDLWVPRGDPLWRDDVTRAAGWVGEWWATGLAAAGVRGAAVHTGRAVPSPWSGVVCFAGVGPGEVLVGGRKVVGLCQWRSRQGALFHTAAYRRWDPAPLVGLLAMDEGGRRAVTACLESSVLGLEELVPRPALEALSDGLLASLPGDGWDVVGAILPS